MPTKTPSTHKPIPSNPKLEALLLANRDDKSNWQVYADWLLEHGEPWGEVIVKACAATGQDEPPKAAEVKTLLSHVDGGSLEFKYGVVDHFELAPEECPEKKAWEERMPKALEAVLKHPAGHLLRSLSLGLPPRVPGDINWHFEDVIAAVDRAGPLPLLQELDMTKNANHMDQYSWRRIGDIHTIWKSAPNLEVLRLQGSSGSDGGKAISFGDQFSAPRLRRLVFISSGLSKVALQELAKGDLPVLRELELYLGSSNYGNSCSLEVLVEFLKTSAMPSLNTLGLMNSEWEDEEEGTAIDAIADAPMIGRIKRLDLSKGTLFRDGVAALVRNAKKLQHLEWINLDENFIPEESRDELMRVLPNADLGEQREPDDEDGEYRYVVVGE